MNIDLSRNVIALWAPLLIFHAYTKWELHYELAHKVLHLVCAQVTAVKRNTSAHLIYIYIFPPHFLLDEWVCLYAVVVRFALHCRKCIEIQHQIKWWLKFLLLVQHNCWFSRYIILGNISINTHWVYVMKSWTFFFFGGSWVNNKYFGLYRFPLWESYINPYFCLGKMNRIDIMIVKTLNFGVRLEVLLTALKIQVFGMCRWERFRCFERI
jgi:hypothetical protein